MRRQSIKACGRKRPRSADADDDDIRILATSVLQNKRAHMADTAPAATLAKTVDDMDKTVSTFTEYDTCKLKDDPPPGKRGARKMFQWIGCDRCPRWFHNVTKGHIDIVYTLQLCYFITYYSFSCVTFYLCFVIFTSQLRQLPTTSRRHFASHFAFYQFMTSQFALRVLPTASF